MPMMKIAMMMCSTFRLFHSSHTQKPMPTPPVSISAATITSHATPIDEAHAGHHVRQHRREQDLRDDLPLGQVQHARDVEVVLRHARTPTAVLTIIGHMLEMKITQIAAGLAALNTSSPIGSQASGDTGRSRR